MNRFGTTRGLPFTGDNVRLIMDGRKTATRRANVKVDQYKRLKPGDLIYVKETYNILDVYEVDNGVFEYGYPFSSVPKSKPEYRHEVIYRADQDDEESGWRPPMFMPKWASRLWLQCTATWWTERIWDITEEGAVAEGMTGSETSTPREDYELLWDQINAKRGPEYRWDANPPVRVIEFRRIDL